MLLAIRERVQLKHAIAHADAEKGGHGVKQRTETLVGVQIAADDAKHFTATPISHGCNRLARSEDVCDRNGRQTKFTGLTVLGCVYEHDEVTRLDQDRRSL